MPLSNPPSTDVIYAELNTPPAGPAGSQQNLDFDTWYDINTTDNTSTKTAALARLGLSYAAGLFTTLRAGVWAVSWDWDIATTPGGACVLRFLCGDFLSSPTLAVASPNTLGNLVYPSKVFALPAGDTFRWTQQGTNSGDVPLDYMDAAIVRLV